MSKYPPFDRVTAGRLNVGDTILVRDGYQDTEWLLDAAGNTLSPQWENGQWIEGSGTALPHGQHQVSKIDVEMHRGYGKASRYYVLTFADGSRVRCSAVNRWNRVVTS